MREFTQTRRGLNNPQPSTAVSFRTNGSQEKDESLAAIMARRRQIADSEKVGEADGATTKTFSPRSNRMKRRESMESASAGLSIGSDHSKANSVATPPQQPQSEPLNELQMAMFKRRTKVEDTTASIVSPRQKRRSLTQHHIPMAPALQEKLQKQLHRVDGGSNDYASSPQSTNSSKKSGPKVSLSALPSPIPRSPQRNDSDDRSTATTRKVEAPKVSMLSVLPSPIPTSPQRSHESIDSDDRSRISAGTTSTNTSIKSRLLTRMSNDNNGNFFEDETKPDDIIEEEEILFEEQSDGEEEEEIGFEQQGNGEEEDQSETETSILYEATDQEDDIHGAYVSSDDGINIGSNMSSSDDHLYAMSEDDSTKEPIPFIGVATNRQRSPARRRRRKPATGAVPRRRVKKDHDNYDVDDGAEPSYNESGLTFFDGSNAHEYPIASDTEDERDPFAGFSRADKFAKSDSFLNDSKHDNMNIESSENKDDDARQPEKVTGESEDEVMVMYASTSTGGPLYDDHSEEASIYFNNVEDAKKSINEEDDLAQFVKERSSSEFNDFGGYGEDEKEEVEAGNDPADSVGRHDSGHTTVFSYSQSEGASERPMSPMSLSSKRNDDVKKETIFGGKVVDERPDRDVPLGDEEDSSSSTSSGGNSRSLNRKKWNKEFPITRFCSRPMVIALVLVGSVVIGVCIGLFLLSGNNADNSTPVPTAVNDTKPEINDPHRLKIPPENRAAYDIICPLLTECAVLIDSLSPSGKAFNWLVQNKTANPDLDSLQNETIVQRYALAAVYYSAGGESWVDSTNWLSSADVCDWFSSAESGSGCGVEGQTVFTTLQLDINNVKGEIPFELSLLEELSKISIQNPVGTDQYLKGTFPSNIGTLTSLTSLVLSGNQFSSGIPLEIGLCTSLNLLDLSNNGMNGEIPTSLSALANLTVLNLEGNFFTGNIDPTIFEGTKNLVDVNLEGNKFTGLPETIVALATIHTLLLGSNSFATFPLAVTQLSTLTSLGLNNNGMMQSIPPQLGRMTALKELDLSRNQLTGAIPVEIGNLVNLELLLDLSFNTLTNSIPSRIGQLVKLRRLRLDGNRLSGAIPTSLAYLSKIEEIRLDDNNLTGAVPVEICTLYDVILPASYADCSELRNATCITNCCSGDTGCVCQFENTDPLLCLKDLQ